MNDTTGDTTPDAMDRATRHDVVSVIDAAAILGITPDSVRARLRRGTLAGAKVGDSWEVHLPRDTIARQDAMRDTTSRDATEPDTMSRDIDLKPLAAVIRDQNHRIEELAAAAAFWQVRAQQAEAQLLQLTAGEPTVTDVAHGQQETAPEPPGSPQASEAPEGGIRAWWRRLLGS